MGVAVISTNKGLMSDRKARKENIGGENYAMYGSVSELRA